MVMMINDVNHTLIQSESALLKCIIEIRKSVDNKKKFSRHLRNRGEDFVYFGTKLAYLNYNDGKVVPFDSSIPPSYEDMSDRQLICYITWRTKLRRGKAYKVPVAYIYVYFMELINNIGVGDPVEGARKIALVWKVYRKYDNGMDGYLKKWFKDYYLCNNISIPFSELVVENKLDGIYSVCKTKERLDLIFTSSHTMNNSMFISEFPVTMDLICDCFNDVMSQLEPLFQVYGVDPDSFDKHIANSKKCYFPFAETVYNMKYTIPAGTEKVIDLVKKERYQFSGIVWYKIVKVNKNKQDSLFFGYTLKKIESLIRQKIKYRKSISVNKNIFIKEMTGFFYPGNFTWAKELLCDPNLDRVIESVVQARVTECVVTCDDSITYNPELFNEETLSGSAGIILTDKNSEIYKKISELRKLPGCMLNDEYCFVDIMSFNSKEQKSTEAMLQLMHPLEDDYDIREDFDMIFPIYSFMSVSEIRTYLTWRTGVRKGMVNPICCGGIQLYVFEIVSGIECEDVEEGLEKLFILLRSNIASEMGHWLLQDCIKDYYLINDFENEFMYYIDKYGCRDKFPSQYMFDFESDDFLREINALSKYNIFKSKFYSADKYNIFNDCLKYVFKSLTELFSDFDGEFMGFLLYSASVKVNYKPFVLYYDLLDSHPENKTVKINTDIYECDNGEWFCTETMKIDGIFRNKVGYILKQMEAQLRIMSGYKYRLNPSSEVIRYCLEMYLSERDASGKISCEDIDDAINQGLLRCFKTNEYLLQLNPFKRKKSKEVSDIVVLKPVEVNMDKLEKIRSDAEEIKEKLLVENELQSNEIFEVTESDLPDVKEADTKEAADTERDVWKVLIESLSETDRSVLGMILSNMSVNDEFISFLSSRGEMAEVVLERINEVALEIVGDNILETAGTPYVYEEYVDIIRSRI